MDFKRLIYFRKNKELSQREMASILNVSKSTYARWETGEEIIPLRHFTKFCLFYKVTMDYVLGISKKNDFNKYDYTKKISKDDIGINIKKIRTKEKLSQKDLAKIFNTSQSTISAYENGKTLVLTIFAYQISREFNISLDELCGLEKKKVTIKK